MRALGVSQNAASACRSRETLSATDLQPLSNSVAKKTLFRHFLAFTPFHYAAKVGVSKTKETAMKGDAKVIEFLNEALKNELTAVNQYWLHYRMLDNWGVSRLADFERHESIDEMKHADKLSERILFLDGLPNFQMLGRLRIGETVDEILKADLELEYEALPLLKDAIAYSESVRDYVSRDLFASILESEEEHVDMLEKQFDLIARMGMENYVQLQSKPIGD
jgi:bacterioferritin